MKVWNGARARVALVVFLLPLVLAAASCGGDESSPAAPIPTPSSSAPPVVVSPPPLEPPVTWQVTPGMSIQAAVDKAKAGDILVINPGLYEQPLGRNGAMVSIEKPLTLDIQAGATLRVAANQSVMMEPSVITNQSGIRVDETDLTVRYASPPARALPFVIQMTTDGLRWAVSSSSTPPSWDGEGIAGAAGQTIALSHGVSITLNRVLQIGSQYFVTFDPSPYHVIRIGSGFQAQAIDGVTIRGGGTIDANIERNLGQPTSHGIDLPSCLLVNGRVRNMNVSGLRLINCHRAIMVLAEHTGTYGSGGTTLGGESFDAQNLTFEGLEVQTSLAGFLIGHPEHRGYISEVTIHNNLLNTSSVSIEPNFRLSSFTVSGNRCISKNGVSAIHLWRGPSYGKVFNNVRAESNGRGVVLVSSLPNWPQSEGLDIHDNVEE